MNKWGGHVTRDGKYGLYAPGRGGLELLELKHGRSVRTFIPKVNESIHFHPALRLNFLVSNIFHVLCCF